MLYIFIIVAIFAIGWIVYKKNKSHKLNAYIPRSTSTEQFVKNSATFINNKNPIKHTKSPISNVKSSTRTHNRRDNSLDNEIFLAHAIMSQEEDTSTTRNSSSSSSYGSSYGSSDSYSSSSSSSDSSSSSYD